MLGPEPEMVWKGRIHLGDEPGIYGDASYSGLAAELPITLSQTSSPGPDTTTLVVTTEDVRTFAGYPGHRISVILYEPEPARPTHWQEIVLATARLTTSDHDRQELLVDLSGHSSPYYISVRVRIDTDVPAGLYDDFVWRTLSNQSVGFRFVASFGFQAV